jgi:hypothetical protein
MIQVRRGGDRYQTYLVVNHSLADDAQHKKRCKIPYKLGCKVRTKGEDKR